MTSWQFGGGINTDPFPVLPDFPYQSRGRLFVTEEIRKSTIFHYQLSIASGELKVLSPQFSILHSQFSKKMWCLFFKLADDFGEAFAESN